MTHPLNSDETAIVIDTIHQNLQPDEYIKHDDSPLCLLEFAEDGALYHTNLMGTPRTVKDELNFYAISITRNYTVDSEIKRYRDYLHDDEREQ